MFKNQTYQTKLFQINYLKFFKLITMFFILLNIILCYNHDFSSTSLSFLYPQKPEFHTNKNIIVTAFEEITNLIEDSFGEQEELKSKNNALLILKLIGSKKELGTFDNEDYELISKIMQNSQVRNKIEELKIFRDNLDNKKGLESTIKYYKTVLDKLLRSNYKLLSNNLELQIEGTKELEKAIEYYYKNINTFYDIELRSKVNN